MKHKSAQLLCPVYRKLLSILMLTAAMSFAFPLHADDTLPQPLDFTTTDSPDNPAQDNAVSDMHAHSTPTTDMHVATMSTPLNSGKPIMNSMHFITLGRVHFVSGKWELTKDAKHALDQVTEYLADHPGTDRLLLDGHTDQVGGNAYNNSLSDKRAIAVETYLISKGLDPHLIHWKGYGKHMPIDESWTRNGQGRNRQVELYAVYLPFGG